MQFKLSSTVIAAALFLFSSAAASPIASESLATETATNFQIIQNPNSKISCSSLITDPSSPESIFSSPSFDEACTLISSDKLATLRAADVISVGHLNVNIGCTTSSSSPTHGDTIALSAKLQSYGNFDPRCDIKPPGCQRIDGQNSAKWLRCRKNGEQQAGLFCWNQGKILQIMADRCHNKGNGRTGGWVEINAGRKWIGKFELKRQ